MQRNRAYDKQQFDFQIPRGSQAHCFTYCSHSRSYLLSIAKEASNLVPNVDAFDVDVKQIIF